MEMVDQAMADFDTAVKLKPDFSIACVQKTYTDYRHACATEVISDRYTPAPGEWLRLLSADYSERLDKLTALFFFRNYRS